MSEPLPPLDLMRLRDLGKIAAQLQNKAQMLKSKAQRTTRISQASFAQAVFRWLQKLQLKLPSVILTFFGYETSAFPSTQCIGVRITLDDSHAVELRGWPMFKNFILTGRAKHLKTILTRVLQGSKAVRGEQGR